MALDPIALGLPHRAPFIFVDAVAELQPGESAVGRKVFADDEPLFRGHFPGDPLVPGVIITEALAQTAGLAAGQAGRSFRLTAIKAMKFLAAVRPGEELILHAQKRGAVGGLWQFDVKATVGETTVAEGVVVLSEAP
jgi:3-hydroxyacyl-[acyl-carrier-protein] dehydratase